MTPSWQARVKAHLQHLVCPPHEEVYDGISYHTVGKPLDDVVVAISYMQAVALLSPFLHWYGVTVCCSVTSHLPHCTTNLNSWNNNNMTNRNTMTIAHSHPNPTNQKNM